MIHTKTTYEIICDDCGKILDTNAASARIARETAERKGWKSYIIFTGEKHYCPECRKNHIILETYYGG